MAHPLDGTPTSSLIISVFLLFLIQFSQEANIQENRESEGEDIDYGVTLDLGSSHGSAYIYTWPHQHDDKSTLIHVEALTDETGHVLKAKAKPGIASIPAEDGFNYVNPMLKFAKYNIPASKHNSTGLYLMGTAGMRLMDDSKKEALIHNLATEIPQHYDFEFGSDHVEIISGSDEALYKWLATNYRLDKLKADAEEITEGIMEMGGASLQIAFQVPHDADVNPDFKSNIVELKSNYAEDEDLFHYSVYAKSFLGFGSDKMFDIQREEVIKAASGAENGALDDCLPKGFSQDVTTATGEVVKINGTGNWKKCLVRLHDYIKSLECDGKSYCVHTGISEETLEDEDFYAFASFWYVVGDFFHVGKKYSFPELAKNAMKWCDTDWSVLVDELKTMNNPYYNEHTLSFQCFKSAWSAAVIHHLFHLSHSYKHLTLTSKVNGYKAPWTLGAMIYKTSFSP